MVFAKCPAYPLGMQSTGIGPLLRQWRQARRMSQQQLAEDSEVSARHISFIENGKTAPSRQMVLLLTSALDLPLRARNLLLSSAGYAPVYRESSLDEPAMAPVRQTFDLILGHHEPYPAVVLTHLWDIVKMNDAGARVFGYFMEPPVDPIIATNVMHGLFHPNGFRKFVVNWDEVTATLIDRLYREAIVEPEESGHRALLSALQAYPGVPNRFQSVDVSVAPQVCIHLHLKKGKTELRLFTTLTTLGTPVDVTAQELRIESYFPADDATDRWLRSLT